MDFSEFFLEDGLGLGLENLRDQNAYEGEDPASSDEESCALSEHHSDNESVGYSVGGYKREREGSHSPAMNLSLRTKGLSLS